jgi:hypothetical protein
MSGPGGDQVDAIKSFIVRAFVLFNLHTSPAQMQLPGKVSGCSPKATVPCLRLLGRAEHFTEIYVALPGMA